MKESYSAAKALKLHTDLKLRLVNYGMTVVDFACHPKDLLSTLHVITKTARMHLGEEGYSTSQTQSRMTTPLALT